MAISRNIAHITTRIGDFLTGAQGDRSGALSVLNDILGPLPAPEHPSMLENRAEDAGMLPVIRAWQEHDQNPPTDESTIHALFRPAEIERFSTQTGLSEPAAMNILREMLPMAIRHRAVTAQASRSAQQVQ
ncbi:YidB family protein [Komagataeibacter sp. FNDCF1]|uniref:YidB family protein n=1 Tax=Komagataeibacter sp. FNDCF1 TaxID=2878681 RepID=UPI001E3433AB|nr:YidB family protein [Komagataeibacter sp. FNDCF1]MCE2563627.1 YidB family protein [Komagataeibacter sp. FNDCF1]